MARQLVLLPHEVIGQRVRELRKSVPGLNRRTGQQVRSLPRPEQLRPVGDREAGCLGGRPVRAGTQLPTTALLLPHNDRVRVMVGNRGEKPSRLRDWIFGRTPLDVPTDIEAFRAYGREVLDQGGMTVGPMLHALADRID